MYIYIYIYIYVYMYVYIYRYVAGCYATWNNNYSGQEEAALCIVKYLKEDWKLVFQIRNKVHVQQQCQRLHHKLKLQKSTWIYIQEQYIPGQKESVK